MVFENFVADLVNRFLGDFIDNLDGSQLKIGIWGGDVKLSNLEIKSGALDQFDLPVKIQSGFIDSLVLKIPWKNLYTQPVIAQVDDLYLVVVPNKAATYNEEKIKQADQNQKQSELARLEENRRNRRKGKDSAVDSFTEKLVEQIIKNLQIKIKNIHVRYEDKFTHRKRPFCCGITLDALDFQTTDENWAPTILKETVKIFNKLVSLQNLSVYWNSDTKLLLSEETDKKKIRDTMRNLIATTVNKPEHEYVLRPINMTAKLVLNQKPESDGSNWTIPKIDLDVDMEQLVLSLNRHQYQDFLLFLDAQDQFQLASKYLKYRPKFVEYRGQYKEWWKFAYKCVLEDQIRRKKRNWSWEMMKAHRALVKQYMNAFLMKRTEATLDKESKAVIEKAENLLNVFNLNIARQQAEIEIDRRGLTRLEDKPKEGWGSWVSGWWSGGKKEQNATADDKDTVMNKFQKEMTEAEKQKLYEAIDFQENMPPTDYPKHYVENRISIKLNTIAVIIEQALELKFGNLSAYVEQRPAASAILIKSAIKTLEMTGCGQSMLSMLNVERNWMDLEIETNPLKQDLDVIVLFRIQPVLLKYHAPAINTTLEVFKPPESIRLEQLTNIAFARYEGVKARSITGLQYAVDKKSKVKIDIKIDSMTIVVSEGGTFDEKKANMILELGTLTFMSTDKTTPDAYKNIRDEKQRAVVMSAYDKFTLSISNVQLLYSVDYRAFAARLEKDSEHHILKPITLAINIHKAAVEDLSMSKLKVFGDLSDILFHTTDSKLIGLAALLLSIPLPESDNLNEDAVVESIADTARLKALLESSEVELDKPDETQMDDEEEMHAQNKKKIQEQQVLVDVSLKLNLIGVTVIKKDETLVIARINQFGFNFQMRTYDMVAHAYLGSITMEQPGFKDLMDPSKSLFFVDYPDKEHDLIVMDVIKADKKSPFFDTEYKKTELLVKLEFRTLNLSLHQDALVEIKTFVEDMMKDIGALQEKQTKAGAKLSVHPSNSKLRTKALSASIDSLFTKNSKKLERQKRHLDEAELNSIIGMHVSAHLHALNVILGDTNGAQTSVGIREISFDMILKPKTTTLLAVLHTIVVRDETPGAVHSSLLSVRGEEAMFKMDVLMFNRTADERKKMHIHDVDMGVKINLAQIQFVFLNLWVNRMLYWIAPFQEQAEKAKEVAAERASEAAQSVKQVMIDSPPRMSLDVKLAAPKIIVPKMSTSKEVISVDLGQLHLKNTFNKAGNALIDDMSIQLNDVNISTGRLDHDKLTENCQMLKPLSFILSVARNLEFERAKDLPELTVKAYLPFIDLSMSQMDYVLMMHILAGNLAEGPVPPPSKAPVAAPRMADANQDPAITDKKTNVNASSAKRIVFKFEMDDIDLALYSGTGMAANKDHGDRNKKESFASMKIHELLVSGYMSEDGGMSVAVSLDAFSMSDEREEQTKLRQLMDKKPGQEQHKFVNLKFNQNSRGDKDIIITSSAFYLFLSPEFLGKLSSFFVVPGLPNDAGMSPAVVGKQEMAKQLAINAGTNVTTSVKPKTPVQSPAPQQDQNGSLALKGSINDIEIILIEDALNPKSSQALILSFNALLDGDTKDGKQHIVGEVRNLQIVSTYFAEELRHLASYNVLNKLNITLNIDIDMASQAQVVTAKMDTVHIKVSPAVIRLLSAVGNQFSENRIQLEDKNVPVLGEYPDFWKKRKYLRHEYWWFNDVAEEATEEIEMDIDEQKVARRLETATFSINRFVVTLESGTEEESIPLILLESRLEATASNWSTSLSCDAETQLQISYYNEAFSVWEPVIEPVLKEKNGQSVWGPWNMTMKVRSTSDDYSVEPGVVAPPKMQVSIDAVDVMNITVTKSFLLLLSSMSSAFEKAAKNLEPPKTRELPGNSPYLILNDTGVVIKIANSDSMKVTEGGAIDATHGEFLELNVSNWEQKVGLQQDEDNRKAELCLQMMDTTREVNVMRAETRSFRLPRHAASGRQWNVVVDTNIENNRRIVTLKSLINFVNHTDMKLEVHSQRDTSLDFCGFVETNETPLNIALPLLYTPSGDFFIRPANDLYETSNESLSWHSLEETNRAIVRCDMSANPKEGCYFDLVAVEEAVLGELGPHPVEKQWTIHIYPPMVFRNLLPFPVKLEEPKRQTLDGGEDLAVNVIPGMKLKLSFEYEGPYTAVFDISPKHEELEVITFVSDNDATKELYLGIHWSTLHRRRDCQLYCPYWLVNNTGKELKYMESVSGFIPKSASSCYCSRRRAASQPEFCSRHPPNKNPVLLPFADKNFCSKKKAKVSIENSAFSQDFPLDIAGSAARVTCKDGNREYELTVDIQVCQSGLTKVVSFSPFYLLFNESTFAMEVCEPESTEWISVAPESCTGLWPKQKSKRKMITARYLKTQAASIPFPFTENFEAFCSIKSDHLGLYVTCSVGESSSVVHIEPFHLGMAPAQIMNATEFPVEFGQKGHAMTVLKPWETTFFKWEDVMTHDRKLEWKCGDHVAEDGLDRNTYSSFLPSKSKGYHYWVSFLMSRQRVFLLTDDLAVLTTAQQAYEVERMDLQAEINIQGIGISIVNNLVLQEILYMGISCSGIIWEQKQKNRFKTFAVKDIECLEDCYQKWLTGGKPEGRHQLTLAGNSVGIDFNTMILYRKAKTSEVKIRRNYANGLWMLYRQSAHQKQVHLKVNHLQIDNQLPACVFPCVLAMVPPPKSVVADSAPKPFTELSLTMQNSEHSSIVQYKYLHVLVQEFAIRLDQGLINSLIAMFTTEATAAQYNKEMFQKDLELAQPHLSEKALSTAATQQKAFFDDLHISPLMIHLSFSQGGVVAGKLNHQTLHQQTGEKEKKDEHGGINIQSEFINVLLKSVGVSLTELQDVIFKLGFFERRNVFYSQPQLQAEIQSHYTMQFVKQLYVLVLGLDIIGNPFGLVRDLSSGVEDLFYQPFQGAIQGPEEFAEGLALGVTSLFGHALGGTASAVSRITGTLGKGVAALTLDDEYQRKRQEALNRKPQNLGEGLSRGAKGLGMGFYEGVTGIVTKPVEGMKKGGFGGLVTGVGKGLVGVVTRPVSGVVDFASSSLDAVKTIAGANEDTKALRPPRFIPRDQIVRPYDFTEAVGYKFFRDTDRGKYADTDNYITYGLISDRCVFIVTDNRVFLAKRQDLLGTWVADWMLEYDEMSSIKRKDNGITFELKQKKKGLLGFGGTKGKVVQFNDVTVTNKVAARVDAAFEHAD